MIVYELSPPAPNIDEYKDTINVIYQFFIHSNKLRQQENEYCLKQLVENTLINNIYLLTEREYTTEELGTSSTKITQQVIGKRLSYKDFFDFVDTISGYCILINSDIFFDNTLSNIFTSGLAKQKSALAQLRFEFNGKDELNKCKIFGPRYDSQDAWIIHSKFNIQKKYRKAFDFNLGKPGCDNKILYLLKIMGFTVYNDPNHIKCYHYHTSQVRDYNKSDLIKQPYVYMFPYGYFSSLQGRMYDFSDNEKLYNYILRKIEKNENFIIPRISSVENNYAVYGRMYKQNELSFDEFNSYYLNTKHIMKNNAGIKLSNMKSIVKYSDAYLSAFDNCEVYGDWEPHGAYYQCIQQSHDWMSSNYKMKTPAWSYNFDVFHFIFSKPWTTALKGKRVLLITPFEESISSKLSKRENIYGIDLFPECSFSFLKPPQTHAGNDSREFDIELEEFFKKLEKIKDDFDIGIVSAGGYGNLILSKIYDIGKSGIYGGGTLQMFFGVLGQRWLVERPDVLKLFMNSDWSRPRTDEKPKDCKNIENGCYW